MAFYNWGDGGTKTEQIRTAYCRSDPFFPEKNFERKKMRMIYELSGRGGRHAEAGEENQDCLYSVERGGRLVISLADGVSTCRRARDGAEIASRAIGELMEEKGRNLLNGDQPRQEEWILDHILRRLKKRSREEGDDLEEYSSTAASVLVDRNRGELLYFNLGDGLILGVDGGKCRILSMPGNSARGCCVTTTRNAAAEADLGKRSLGTMERVLICSDGAWREMYGRTRLLPEVSEWLVRGEWGKLEHFLRERGCRDDYSIIAIEP